MVSVFLYFLYESLALVVPIYSEFFHLFIGGIVIALILNMLRQFLYRGSKK